MPFTIVDNVIVAIILWQMIKKVRASNKRYKQRKKTFTQTNNDRFDASVNKTMDISEAYKTLGASQHDSLEEVRKSYFERISKNHPDKVTHLSEELQIMASQITLKLNQAFDTIKRRKL